MCVKVSVIIPVYNCEKYIGECIESLINQTLNECEFIFVNDGSNDRSKNIIEGYIEKDNRIKLINQKNSGVSIARNTGLKYAIGDYIGFVDGDDYIDKFYYEKLYNFASKDNIDLIISNFEQELDGKKIINKLDIEVNSIIKKSNIINGIIPQFLEHEKLNTVCTKLFKREIIDRFNIRFPKGVALGEDGLFNINYFSNVNSLMYIDYCGYYYREVQGSATRNIVEKDYFNRALEIYNEEMPEIYYKYFKYEYLNELKSKKFINNVISYTYIYFNPENNISFRKRYRYVKNMINNASVKISIKKYWNIIYSDKSNYEKLLMKLIKKRLTIGIYFLTAYSRLRCR